MDDHIAFMQLAINEATKCSADIKVGAVLARDNEVLTTGYRDELGLNIHAEQCVMQKALEAKKIIKGSTLYVTLEPCSDLSSKNKIPCCDQLIEQGVRIVYIGCYDQNPTIYRNGWKKLMQSGLIVKDFDNEHARKAKEINKGFSDVFEYGIYDASTQGNGAKFDYSLNGGRFDIFVSQQQEVKVRTRWSQCGADSIYANGGVPGFIALARHAKSFEEIDNPDALDYEPHAIAVEEGEIVVFRNKTYSALVKVVKVKAGPDRGEKEKSLHIKYEIRER